MVDRVATIMHGHKAVQAQPVDYPPRSETLFLYQHFSPKLAEPMLISPWAHQVSGYARRAFKKERPREREKRMLACSAGRPHPCAPWDPTRPLL